jgi:hypothetical protein
MAIALTSLANVKAFAQISSSGDDPLLQRLVDAASSYIAVWCSRNFDLTSRTQTYNGNGRYRMPMRDYPITQVDSVKVNGLSIPARTSPQGSGYVFDDILVYLSGYTFEQGIANVEITYSAGYVAVPADLEQACIEMVVSRYRERSRLNLNSQAVAGESVTFNVQELSRYARSVLQQYKRVTLL